MVNFSVIVPTIGRPCLPRLLDSIAGQEMIDGDEVIVIADTLDGAQPETERIVKSYGYQYEEFAGQVHCWGMPQRNYALGLIKPGNFYVGNDDTDFFLPDVFSLMREKMNDAPNEPHIFGFIATWGIVPGYPIQEGSIGG